MPAPLWAIQLVETVCKEYRRAKPSTFKWRQLKRRTASSGRAWTPGKSGLLEPRRLKNGKVKYRRSTGIVHISAGTDVKDQRLVLLHELSHHIAGRSRDEHHGIRFWRLAFELYERYGLELEYAYAAEMRHGSRVAGGRAKATQAYDEIKAQRKTEARTSV